MLASKGILNALFPVQCFFQNYVFDIRLSKKRKKLYVFVIFKNTQKWLCVLNEQLLYSISNEYHFMSRAFILSSNIK